MAPGAKDEFLENKQLLESLLAFVTVHGCLGFTTTPAGQKGTMFGTLGTALRLLGAFLLIPQTLRSMRHLCVQLEEYKEAIPEDFITCYQYTPAETFNHSLQSNIRQVLRCTNNQAMAWPARVTWGMRIVVVSTTIAALALASLNSTTAHLASILRDRARAELFASANGIADNTFTQLMDEVIEYAILTAVVSALFATVGLSLVARPSWLREHERPWVYYMCIQVSMGLLLTITGGCLAGRVHGYNALFERFGQDDTGPYHEIMYYGGLGQAIYGSLAMVFPFIALFIFGVETHNLTERSFS